MQSEARIERLEAMLSYVRQGCVAAQFDADQSRRMELAAEEALVNVIRHAYPNSTEGEIELEWSVPSSRSLQLTIRDRGVPFNPAQTPARAHKSEGGVGLQLMHQLVDEISYQRVDDQNILVIIRHS